MQGIHEYPKQHKSYLLNGGVAGLHNNPAPASNIIITVPAGKLWKAVVLQLRLSTDATAGARTIYWIIKDEGGNEVMRIGVGTQNPSTTWYYHLGDWPNHLSSNITWMVALPQNFVLKAGWTIESQGFGYGAADQWLLNNVLVNEYVA